MKLIKFPIKKRKIILALGAESAGLFTVYHNGNILVSKNFGDLLEECNFMNYKTAVLDFIKKEKIKPDVIITDLHPLFKTTVLGEELAKKYKISHIKIQHHIAHIFSAIGDQILTFCHSERSRCGVKNLLRMQDSAHSCEISRFARNDKMIFSSIFFGIVMDGTGYGLDGNIWGGEVFKISNDKFQMTNQIQNPKFKIEIKTNNLSTERIGSLEEQIMIGGDLAVKEPARMLIAILAKITKHKLQIPNKTQITNSKTQKDFIYKYVKKFYTRNEFEALYNQMEQNFNCQKTTSTGRILDAVAVLLGFARNERNFKHEAVKKLEENSAIPYSSIKPRIIICESRKVLDTTYLFEYLIRNIHRNKKRLAATAQLYIAKGLYEIIKKTPNTKHQTPNTIFAAGGITNNKIISEYLRKHGVYLAKKIPRGDEGISFGQIIYYLTNSRH